MSKAHPYQWISQDLVLQDVMQSEPSITAYMEVGQGTADDGIVLFTSSTDPYRVVIENYEGRLMVYVWATEESLGNEPTHSIQIGEGA